MASTYSDLKFELIGTGEQSGTWGATTNVNLGTAIEEAIVGRANANFSTDADLTLTLTNTNSTQVARHYILNVTSGVSLTVTRNLIVPTIDKPYIIENNTTGSQSIVVKTSAGTGVTIPNGKKCMVYANSTNVVQASDYFPAITTPSATITGGSITGITDLAVADGGTGASDASGARTNLGIGTIATQAANSVTITGGSITGITDLAVADGGTGASDASGARTNLGLVIGTNVQAWNTNLDTYAGKTPPSGAVVGTTDSQTLTNKTLTTPTVNNPTVTNYTETLYTATGSTTVDLANGTVQKITTDGNNTITLPSSVVGKSFVIMVAYGGTHTVTWAGGSTIKWAFGSEPTQTSANGKIDIFTFFCDGTNTYGGTFGTNF